MRRAQPRRWLRALTAGALLPLTGCAAVGAGTGPTSGGGPEPALGAVPTISSSAQVTRPIDDYLPTGLQIAALLAVAQAATVDCYAAHGVTATPQTTGPGEATAFFVGAVADRTVRSDLWGFFGTDTVAAHGYARPPQTPGGLTLGLAVPDGTSDEVRAACDPVDDGSPADGPMSLTEVLDLTAPSSLPDGGPPVPGGDSRYVGAVQSWASCMAARGFAATDPLMAMADPRWTADQQAGAVSPAQLAAASADVGCKVSTNLVGIGIAVQRAYDEAYVTTHRAALDAFVARWRAALGGAS